MNIYYINLDRSMDRRRHMEAQFAWLGLTCRRISAVDGAVLGADRIARAGYRQEAGRREMSRGEIACFLSHRNVWDRIGAGAEDYGVVMEDDLLMSRRAKAFLTTSSWVPDDTDLLKLETTHLRIRVGTAKTGSRIVLHDAGGELRVAARRLYPTSSGAGCYLLHRTYARWLAERYATFSWPVDYALIGPTPFGHEPAHIRQLIPALAMQHIVHAPHRVREGTGARFEASIIEAGRHSAVQACSRTRSPTAAVWNLGRAATASYWTRKGRLLRTRMLESRRTVVPFLEEPLMT